MRKDPYIHTPGKFYFLIFIILTVIAITVGYKFYNIREENLKKEKYYELSAIAGLKTNQINTWRRNLLADGNIISGNQLFISGVNAFINGSGTIKHIEDRLQLEKKYKNYSSAGIFDKNLRSIAGDTLIHTDSRLSLNLILKNKNPVLSDIYPNEDTTSFMIDLYIPLILKNKSGEQPVGLLILKQDPNSFIYPLIQTWPSPSRTSETLIFRVEGDSLVYLNKLRHINKNPYTLKLPVNDPDLPAAMLARGITGIVEGIDYRGVPVLADLRKIPDSQWLLVTKIDKEEIFAQLHQQIITIIFAVVIIILTLAMATALIWKNQNIKFFRKLYDSELEKKNILLQFESITNHANDIIFLLDEDGKIKYANQKAVDTYGYSYDQIYKLNITDLRDNDLSPSFYNILEQAEKGDGLIYEAVHKTKDGRLFYVEPSATVVKLGDTKVLQEIIRDITERKTFEEQIKKSLKEKEILLKEIHHRVKNNLQIISSLLNIQKESIDNENIRNIFNDSSNRIRSIALVHQKLYSDKVELVMASDYIPHLVDQISKTYKGYSFTDIVYDIENLELTIDCAVPLGLLINEIISNSFKHAFPEKRKGKISIKFTYTSNSEYLLRIEDNGIGLPANYKKNGLGMQLIFTLAEQLDGDITIERNSGTVYILTFKTSVVETEDSIQAPMYS